MSNCKCSKCSCQDDFDARREYLRLSRKYEELSDLVMEYMSEAKLKRPQRVKNAIGMTERLALVVGGSPTVEFPECASIGDCSGVLVHPQIVLTAAHCTGFNSVHLNCLTRTDLSRERIGILRNRQHDNYHPEISSFFDIRVLILEHSANTPHVDIASAQEFSQASQATVVGFGRSETGTGRKRSTSVNIRPFPNVSGIDLMSEFFAGGDGFDTCNGDSGGPAYIELGGGVRKVIGLTSRGLTTCGNGGIYTRVDIYLDFIRRIASESGIHFP